MPGLSLFCDPRAVSAPNPAAIERILASTLVADETITRHLASTDAVLLSSGNACYPVTKLETPGWLTVLEGHLHGTTAPERDARLATLAEGLAAGDHASLKRQLGRLLLDDDFEGVLLLRRKDTGETVLVNDYLGRFPLFFRERPAFVLSRELGFALKAAGDIVPDRVAAAQYLALGYCFGGRTLFSQVNRLPAATMVRLAPGEKPDIQSLFILNLDEHTRAGNSLRVNAEELAALFNEACKARTGSSANVLSLSGGLDSRAVAAALATQGTPFHLASFDDGREHTRRDVSVARSIAEILRMPYDVFQTPRPTGRSLSRLLRMTSGLNPAALAFILFFFDHLRARYGDRLTYFTGDGGDKALPGLLTPPIRMRDHQRLARHILTRSSIFYPDMAAALIGIPPNVLTGSLTDALAAYPEGRVDTKYAHFSLYERARHYLFDGEDRNRRCFSSTAPFYAPRFMRAALACPERQKRNMTLYREFLLALSPKLAVLPYADVSAPITSLGFRGRAMARRALERIFDLRALKVRLSRLKARRGPLPSRFALLTELGGRSEVIPSCFAPDIFADFVVNPGRYTRFGERAYMNALSLIWTYVYFLENRDMLVESYADITF
jgi:asparagine synthase (glutamine-hydrolysing)